MELYSYILLTIATFCGIITGYVLCKLVSEEMKELKKYFDISRLIVIPLIILSILLTIGKYSNYYIHALFVLIIIFLVLVKDSVNPVVEKINPWIYGIFGALLFVSVIYENPLIISVLIFIYGMLSASSYLSNKKNIDMTSLIGLLNKYFYFLIVTILMFIIFLGV